MFDVIVPGLAIRVTPSGHKSWVLYYRYHGRLRRLALGRYPDRKLAEARVKRCTHRGRIFNGADPAAEKQDERATNGDTVGALYDLYKKATEKKRSWPEQRRIFENEVLPAWRHRRVQDMTRRDIRDARRSESGDGADDGEPGPRADLAAIQLRDGARLDRDESGIADREARR